MKHKTYGDNNKEFEYGSGIEIISSKDPISARSVNRPIANLYENQEESYKLLNTLLKSVYGNVENAILPDIYEDFSTEGFVINSFKNDSKNFFLRIPTGMMLLNSNKYNPERNVNNPFSIQGEYDYKEEFNKSKLTNDADYSFVYDNRPNISLLERQLSNFIALDLNDLTNDINIHETETPMTYNVEIRDPVSGFQLFDADGNLSYVTDSSGNQLYICDDENAEFYIEEEVNFSETDVEYNYRPCGENSKLGENYNSEKNKNYYVSKKAGEFVKVTPRDYKEDIKPEGSTSVTTNYNNATKVLDYNGNVKRRIGYYADVVRSTDQDDEITYLPNIKENAYWKVCLPYGGDPTHHNKDKEYTYNIEVLDHKGEKLTSFEFFFFDYASENDINNMLFNKILIEGKDYFIVSKYQFRVNGSELKHGVKISCKSNSNNCNNYKLKITYSSNTFEGDKICTTLDKESGWPNDEINDVLPEPAHRQKCYNNIFELTNAFLGRYSSYQIDIKSIYNYLSGETLIKLPRFKNNFTIYYDINANNLDNGDDEYYDKSGKLHLSIDTETDDKKTNLIKLFDISISRPDGVDLAPRVSKIKVYPISLDKRKIHTKSSEYDTLVSNYRTELNNYVVMGDEDRKIEIAELAEKDDKQTRVTSPVLRLSTENKILQNINPWKDSYGGDGESDFDDSYESRNFVTNNKKTNYHTDGDMGIIINKNKGIKIYNNDINVTKGGHNNLSEYKPIEIVSNRGNINIVSTDRHSESAGEKEVLSNTRINIKNLRDSKNNIIDMLGVTRIRSSQDCQLVIKKREAKDSTTNGASIAFVNGPSEVNYNKNALDNIENHEEDDIIVGKINFYSGKDTGTDVPNKTDDNRMFKIMLSKTGTTRTLKNVILGRNSKTNEERNIITLSGDLVPDNENKNTIGFPIESRTYYEKSETVPYERETNTRQDKADLSVDKNGTSKDFVNGENRWMSSFIHYGYFGKVTLSDREKDINHNDCRDGALRLGDSNIYDISSIYINHGGSDLIRKNVGTINFDNFYDPNYENTIMSSAREEEKSYVGVVINRRMGAPISDPSVEKYEYSFMSQKSSLLGTTFGKDVYVNRQLFVNEHETATQDDNNIFVVKGQSILKGELILGIDLDSLKNEHSIETKKNVTFHDYNHDKETSSKLSNKLYNLEFPKKIVTKVEGQEDDISYEDAKEDHSNLYTFRNYGKAYFSGDITLNNGSKFTEETKFDKKVTINNNAKNGKSYDSKSSNTHDLLNNKYYSDNHNTEGYDEYDYKGEEGEILNNCNTTSRHHVALEVTNGTILLGNDPENEDVDSKDYNKYDSKFDDADLKLSGSQWIKRRLEIGTKKETELFDNYMYNDRLTDEESYKGRTKRSSPVLYVEGTTNINGDIVFGGGLKNKEFKESVPSLEEGKPPIVSTFDAKVVKNWRESNSETGERDPINPIKAIFWGKHEIDSTTNRKMEKTDFDFHGTTWFDNAVKIGGGDKTEDSKDEEGRLIVIGKDNCPSKENTLERWRENNPSVGIRGTISVLGSEGYDEIVGKEVYISGGKTNLLLNNSSSNLSSNGEMNLKAEQDLNIASKLGNILMLGKNIDINSMDKNISISNMETVGEGIVARNYITLNCDPTKLDNKNIEINSFKSIYMFADGSSLNMFKDNILIKSGSNCSVYLNNIPKDNLKTNATIVGNSGVEGTFRIRNVLFEKTDTEEEEILEVSFK